MVCDLAKRDEIVHTDIMKDSEIRAALKIKIQEDNKIHVDTLVVEELGLTEGAIRTDLAVINGSIQGFEIKSERDTLRRLPKQEKVYSKIFDEFTIVLHPKHLEKAIKIIPDWWGIVEAIPFNNTVSLIETRPSLPNPVVDPDILVQLIWRDEALLALRSLKLHKGYSNKPRETLWSRLIEHLTIDELQHLVRDTLKQRKGWRAELLPA